MGKFKLLIFLALLTFYNFISFGQIVEDSLVFGKFGKINIYKPGIEPAEVVIFASGDAGWKYGVIDMAQKLAKEGALVLGIDIKHYMQVLQREKVHCHYISADFEILNQYIQKKYHFKKYTLPVLAGYSSGATLIYGIIAQAPEKTYKGGLALGFCPDISINRPLCKGSGLSYDSIEHGYLLKPRKNLTTPFIVINGQLDEVCDEKITKDFMSEIKNGKFYYLPHVGHGFTKPGNWVPAFLEGYHFIIGSFAGIIRQTTEDELEKLPIVITPAATEIHNMPFIVGISGDGGWKGMIETMALKFADRGIPVAGIDALRYFWNYVSPEKAAEDVGNVIADYMQKWNKSEVILLGYSFGADVLPFIVNRLPEYLRHEIKMVVLMSPDKSADFEFHFTDWFDESSRDAYNVAPELQRLKAAPTVIIYGEKENDSLVKHISNRKVRIIKVPGDHHYNYDTENLVNLIVKEIEAVGLE